MFLTGISDYSSVEKIAIFSRYPLSVKGLVRKLNSLIIMTSNRTKYFLKIPKLLENGGELTMVRPKSCSIYFIGTSE